jgi:hypothetical protein
MLDCLTKLVTYKKQCVGTDGARYWIQQLSGISSEFVANVANVDAPSAAAVFDSKLNLTANLISDKIRTLTGSMVIPSDIYAACACVAPPTLTGVSFQTKTQSYGSQIVFNAVSKIGYYQLNAIRVFSQNAGTNVVFTIKDGATVTTVTAANVFANQYTEIQLPTPLRIKTNRVIIEQTGLNIARYICFESATGCGCSGQKPQNPYQVEQDKFYRVYDYDSLTPDFYNSDGYVSGIQPCIAYRCDAEQIACRFSESLATPMLYLTGAAILQEALITERFNWTTVQNPEILQNMISFNYKEGNKWLDQVAQNIQQSMKSGEKDECIICTGVTGGWAVN